MIIILRSNDLSPDPRVSKYTSFLDNINISYLCIGWDRTRSGNKSKTIFFNNPSEYGLGLSNVFNLVLWNVFIFKQLIKKRNKIKVLHCCDFDTILPALLFKTFFNVKVIFDVFDWFTDCREFNNIFLLKLVKFLEYVAVYFADYIILCEEERLEQLPNQTNTSKVFYLSNIPLFKLKVNKTNVNKTIQNLSYVGILSKHRGLEDLLKVVSKSTYLNLNIAGFGQLESLINKYSSKFENINFYGKVDYIKGLDMMIKSDLIIALYYKSIKNHIFAAPNKYYESLFLSTPLLTTSGTLVGNKVLKHKTGFVIEEGEKNILNFFDLILDNQDFISYSSNCNKLYREKYSKHIDLFMNSDYKRMISYQK